MLYKIFTVAGLATFEVYAAIPTGFLLELSPITIFLASAIGGLVGVFVAAFLGDKIEHFLSKYRKPKKVDVNKKPSLAHTLMEKYGVIGLGFLGTMTVGAPVSIAVGVGFNVPMHQLATWCCIGVVTRCALFTAIGYYGIQLF
ncbi:MAG: small multi-drug export protein [Chitinophagaceae bacterium]|jgi:membrane protein YqaA with SNARE-associated domain